MMELQILKKKLKKTNFTPINLKVGDIVVFSNKCPTDLIKIRQTRQEEIYIIPILLVLIKIYIKGILMIKKIVKIKQESH